MAFSGGGAGAGPEPRAGRVYFCTWGTRWERHAAASCSHFCGPLFSQPLSPAGAPSVLGASQPTPSGVWQGEAASPCPRGRAQGAGWALGAGRQHGPTVLVLSGTSPGLWALVFEPEHGPSSSTQPQGGFAFIRGRAHRPPFPSQLRMENWQEERRGSCLWGSLRTPSLHAHGLPAQPLPRGRRTWPPSPPFPSLAPLRPLLPLPSQSHPIREI